MKLTALDIEQHRFQRAWRGYDAGEVQRFLELLAQQVVEYSRELLELRQELKRTQREVSELRGREESLKEAMLTAKRAIEGCRDSAERQSQLVLDEAELRAERLIAHAQSKSTELMEDITDLRRQRTRLVSELRGVINTHLRLLADHEIDERDIHEPVSVLDSLGAPVPPGRESGGLLT